MLACGIVSRLVSGCDLRPHRRPAHAAARLACCRALALLLFLPFDGLVSLYVISALFGLFQGGIVPSYAIIVREYFPPREAGARVGTVIMCTLFGMALGGWMSGKIFDLTGSYHAAFLNGIAWNLLNLTIALFLLRGARRPAARDARRSLRLRPLRDRHPMPPTVPACRPRSRRRRPSMHSGVPPAAAPAAEADDEGARSTRPASCRARS